MSRRSLSRENACSVRVLSARHPAVPLPGAGGAAWDPGGAQRDLLALGGARARQGNAATGPALEDSDGMWLTLLALRNRIGILMLSLAMVVLGEISLDRLPR